MGSYDYGKGRNQIDAIAGTGCLGIDPALQRQEYLGAGRDRVDLGVLLVFGCGSATRWRRISGLRQNWSGLLCGQSVGTSKQDAAHQPGGRVA